MSLSGCAPGPFGLDAAKGRTFRPRRTVLAVVHTVTAGMRLADVMPLLESDHRIQVVYTSPGSSLFAAGVTEFLAEQGCAVIPFRQAAQIRFDLVVAAAAGGLEQLHGPVLTVPHGAGFSKYSRVWDGPGPAGGRVVAGADPARLVHHGRVTAARIVVASSGQLARLRRECPPAASVAVVAGDPCLDRLLASLPHRAAYRRALGTGDRTLVTVSSTWGPVSLLGRDPGLPGRLAAELPAERYQVAAITHPNAWHWHGSRQVRAWYAEGTGRGMLVVPPTAPWPAVLAAADLLVGDAGSVSSYAAAAGVPVTLASYSRREVDPDSHVARLASIAPRLRRGEPAAAQLARAAGSWNPELHAAFRAEVTSVPGQAARIIRSLMYQLMKLAEPAAPPAVEPVPLPVPAQWLPGPRP
jgi:hypothetical protein